jgi:hypothetical protein
MSGGDYDVKVFKESLVHEKPINGLTYSGN